MNSTYQNQSLGKSELHYYFIRLTILYIVHNIFQKATIMAMYRAKIDHYRKYIYKW